MSYTIDRVNSYSVEIVIKDSWESYEKDAIASIKSEKEIPGFRKGHAPDEMIKAKFNNVISNLILDNFISDKYPEIIKKENLEVMTQPTLIKVDEDGKDLKVKLKVTLFPEVKLGKYKGLKVSKIDAKVKKEDIDSALSYLAGKHATLKTADREAKENDLVVINFEGFVDGVAFEGGKATEYQLRLGSKSFIDTFEDQIIGHKKGDSFEVNVTFPKNYQAASLKGKKAMFKVDLLEVKDVTIPKIDDELAKSENFNNIKEMKEYIEKRLIDGKTREEEERFFNEIIEKISSKSDVEVPDVLIDKEYSDKVEKFKKKEQRDPNKTEEQLIRSKVMDELKEMLIIREIMKLEKITSNEEEVREHIEKNFNMKYEDVKSSDKSLRFLGEVESNIKIEKLKRFLAEQNS